jgi:hypothetical protein
LNWDLASWFRVNAGYSNDKRAPEVEQLGAPVVSYPNFLLFDPVRGVSTDVTFVTGGNAELEPETIETLRFQASSVLVPEYQLLVQAEYVRTVKHDQIGTPTTGGPCASSAIGRRAPVSRQSPLPDE